MKQEFYTEKIPALSRPQRDASIHKISRRSQVIKGAVSEKNYILRYFELIAFAENSETKFGTLIE